MALAIYVPEWRLRENGNWLRLNLPITSRKEAEAARNAALARGHTAVIIEADLVNLRYCLTKPEIDELKAQTPNAVAIGQTALIKDGVNGNLGE